MDHPPIFRPLDGDPPYWLVFFLVRGRWHKPSVVPHRYATKQLAYATACEALAHAGVKAAKVVEYPSETVVHKLTGGKPDGKQLYPSKP